MPGDTPGPDARSDLERARRVNQACERFESRWKLGAAPRIEDELSMAEEDDHPPLFEELLALELELRRDRGDQPLPAEYASRFPAWMDQINKLFDAIDTREATERRDHPEVTLPEADGPSVTPQAQTLLPAPSDPSASDTVVGDYLLLGEIARGGMGIVYKARHMGLKRVVALKMILAGTLASPTERSRFRREAELVANLDHPHIIPIYEVHEQEGLLYFCMKLVDGGSLAQKICNYAGDPRSTARLMATLASAVHYAHGQGFIHCDLKPSNILIDRDGQPQITDFGLARRSAEGDSTMTASGAIMGTPSYMAPEQAASNRPLIGPATDVYGLGAVLYELLTTRPPFRASTIMDTVFQVLERDPQPPREIQPEVPIELQTICLKCLEKQPQDRYPSALALAEDLERYLAGEVINATTTFQRLRRWARREPELASRLIGLSMIMFWTQVNYLFFTTDPRFRIHYTIQLGLVLWAVSAVLFHFLWRKSRGSDSLRMLWSAADVAFLSIEIYLVRRVESPLIVGFPLLIAASGLWARVSVVWFTTVLAMVAYGVLYLESALEWTDGGWAWKVQPMLQYPNIFLTALALCGFVVARQVKRLLKLSQYYENRQNV